MPVLAILDGGANAEAKLRRENFLKLGSGAAIGGVLAAGQPERLTGTVVGWNRLALQAIHTLPPGAAMAARSLAILHTCMYNAWAAYDDDARQTAHGVAVRLPSAERCAASKASAMSHAAWLALSAQFPALSASFDACMAGLGLDPAAPSGQLSPAGIGRTQAAAMLDACRQDAAGQPPDRPAPAGEASDPGQWCLLAQSVSERERHDDDRDVRLFFALTNALTEALADAGHACGETGHACGPAAAEVLRRFTGSALPGATMASTISAAGQESGREAGARAYDKARRYWDGKL